ncbi:MAG: C-type lectin domain-containing protein [Woeseia sp.]|nr:C-type lectin domain-containing protein [Woeseia sp.]MBT8096425.1 C-type lectin domain-containing protein [Woeseia sp.]NNE60751.1 C-type lectin domain-containing protein [Woeseia sp.]NNL54700.1 C-type lectin domain-containing protein [Woeseia sp.]
MNLSRSVIRCIGLTILFGPMMCFAQQPAGSIAHGNNFYQLVTSGTAVTWAAASNEANSASFTIDGTEYRGYLATVTSADENAAIVSLFADPQLMAWLGGYQLPSATYSDEGWRWGNEEGEIAGSYSVDPYANWAPGATAENNEPTNSVVPGSEENVLFGLSERDYLAFAGQNGSWYAATMQGQNANLLPVTSYVIEYEPVTPAPVEIIGSIENPENCKASQTEPGEEPGCNTIDEHRLILPESAEFDPDEATILYRAWTFIDPRVSPDTGRCDLGRYALDPFATVIQSQPELAGELIFQEYLCGSPKITIVKTDAPAIRITTDTVKTIHSKLDGNLFECDPASLSPADPGYAAAAPGIDDPQFRDRTVWRSTLHDAIEGTYNTVYFPSIGENWEGNASDRTNACGSSEGDAEEKSYFVLGMHIDFGSPYDEAEATFDNFVQLTRYKLLRLRDNVELADDDIDSDDDMQKLRKKVEQAIEELDKQHYEHALDDIEKFLNELEKTEFDDDYDEYNRYGELKSRGLNIQHTLAEMVIPFET